MQDRMVVGRGIFTWDGKERHSDRYGAFAIDVGSYDENSRFEAAGWDAPPANLAGTVCRITVRVLEARESGHIGDMFRGISPSKPDVGEIVDLGRGRLFVEDCRFSIGKVAVGLLPDDGRSTDWFDPRKLYRLHDQTVEVTIFPSDS